MSREKFSTDATFKNMLDLQLVESMDVIQGWGLAVYTLT
jgi:hypothetical protein